MPQTAVAEAAAVAHAARLDNRIVPYRSIGGVKLGMTPVQVRRDLGTPSSTVRTNGRISGYSYAGSSKDVGGVSIGMDAITVYFDTNTASDLADGIDGFNPSFRTSTGIHPGSTVSQLRRAYGARLYHGTGYYSMWNGPQGQIGTAETDFYVSDGRITFIDVEVTYKD